MMVLLRFPKWLCEVICRLCKSWNTRIVPNALHGQEVSETIVFKKGLHREMRSAQGCLRSV